MRQKCKQFFIKVWLVALKLVSNMDNFASDNTNNTNQSMLYVEHWYVIPTYAKYLVWYEKIDIRIINDGMSVPESRVSGFESASIE